ncbi:MAG: phospholipase D-like domain-containing protein, partial [Methanomassiliicoccaceae archaeon]|nr:phospholipase D-like domain-containing protein [Methanomassiliicoccaceae archaeon]
FEAVTLYNAGSARINLKNYYLDDGEGTVRFTADLFVDVKQYVTIASNEPDGWFTGRTVYLFGTFGITAKSFILADAGDEVMLRRTSDNKVLDTFVYGNGDTKVPGWNGPAFSRIAAGKMAARCSAFDTDTANDWAISVVGRTDEKISSDLFDAVVTPFVFPDSKGDPVFRALESASSEVLISMYLMDHKDIISLLMMLLDRGVSVTLLLEGSPAGGVPDTEIRYMGALYEKGADIRILKTFDVYKRYDLLHNKYAIVDGNTVIITSENWREGSFSGNRGWGAVIESDGYAEYMTDIFLADSDVSRYDVHSLRSLYQSIPPILVPQYKARPPAHHEKFEAYVKPVISPDFSIDYLKQRMQDASSRIYTEQMSVQYAWTDTTTQSPLSWSLTAAGNGVDVRLLADVTFDTDGGGANNHTLVSVMDGMNGMRARTISGGDNFGLTHNKGVIIDDTVWVSSINWTNAAFLNNRETAAEIRSKDVSDYFASYFLSDWGEDTDVVISVTVTGGTAGEAVILDASSSSFPRGTLFSWDLDGDGVTDRVGLKIAVLLPEGVNVCTLTATDIAGESYVYEFIVIVSPKNESSVLGPYIKYAPILAILLAILAFATVMRMKGR